jgi:hypothetical protein
MLCCSQQGTRTGPMRDVLWRVLRILLLAVIAFVAFVIYAALSSSYERPRTMARLKCSQQLQQLGLYLDMYAGEHDGVYPQAMEPLVDRPLMLRCPGQKASPHVNPHPDGVYAYVGAGLHKDDLVDAGLTPILFDRTPIHLHTRNVLTADGRVRYMDEDEFRSLVAAALTREEYGEDAVRQMRKLLDGQEGG